MAVHVYIHDAEFTNHRKEDERRRRGRDMPPGGTKGGTRPPFTMGDRARRDVAWWELKGEIDGRGRGRLIATNGMERRDMGDSRDYVAIANAKKWVAEMNAKLREADRPKPATMKVSRVGAALLRGRT